MHTPWKPTLFAALTLCALTSSPVRAQDDRLAECPDPAAARKYVNECMQQNPYNTKEVCEQRALETFCPKK